MIFLTATGCAVNWSFAELFDSLVSVASLETSLSCDTGRHIPDQPKGTHSNRLELRVPRNMDVSRMSSSSKLENSQKQEGRRHCAPAGDLEGGAKDLGTHEFRHDGEVSRKNGNEGLER